MSPSDLTDEDIAAIDARANAATAGPWEAPDQLLIPCVRGVSDHGNTIRVCQFGWNNSPDAKRRDAHNAAFVAHAREDVPCLVAEVRRLRAEVATAQDSYAVLRAMLAALTAHENTRGHAHELCGVWDDRAKDGSRRLCARCHLYADARSMVGLPRWSTEGYDHLIARDAEGTKDCAHADDCGCGGKRRGAL